MGDATGARSAAGAAARAGVEAAAEGAGSTGAANPSHAQALVLVDELARCGLTDVVLAPGSRSAALAMAMHDDPRIRLHVELDERSAGFLALGIARASGRPAAVVVTSGSAVANLHPAVVEADTGEVPLLLLTADRPPELRATGANQAIDQLAIFGRAVRWFVDVGVAEDRPGVVAYWRSTLDRAWASALGLAGPAGPVHLNLPFREPTVPLGDDGRTAAPGPFSQPLDGRDGDRPWTVAARVPTVPDPDAVAALATRIAAVRRGLLVLGQTTVPSGPVHELARAAGWPVLAEPTSNARHGDLAVAHAHHLLAHAGFTAAHRPELVVRVGRTGLSRHVAALLDPDVPQVLLDPHGTWHDPERAIGELLVGDPAALCTALAAHLASEPAAPRAPGGGAASGASGPGAAAGSDWLQGWLAADARARQVLDDVLDADDRISEPRVARDLAAALPRGSTLVVASSMPIRDLDQFLAPRDGVRVVANRGASGIDGFVSTVLGVALVAAAAGHGGDGGPTVALAGDLSLLHDANGFLLAPDAERVDATFVVVDNDGGGIFHFLPQAGFPGSFERLFGTPHGRDLEDLARFHRLGYTQVDTASALAPSVAAAIERGGIQLVHVRTDRRANAELHRRLTAAVGEALSSLPSAT
jgi:2-succinyl-5-enolpyruvyl-6-hydroxy-3-cyclohexene-1-carboxylate synthase